jgi:hypothetical protein
MEILLAVFAVFLFCSCAVFVLVGRAVRGVRRRVVTFRDRAELVARAHGMLARLELAARSVDGELRMLDAHPDRARITAQLDGPRSRAQAIIASAAALVDGLLHAASYDADELAMLQAACGIEADSLRATRAAGRPAR